MCIFTLYMYMNIPQHIKYGLQSDQWNYGQHFMDISLHSFNQMINQVACPQIGGFLTQILAFPVWVIFAQLNIWTFRNPNGSLHAIRLSCFPYVKHTVSHFLQQFFISQVQLVSKKNLCNAHVKVLRSRSAKGRQVQKNKVVGIPFLNAHLKEFFEYLAYLLSYAHFSLSIFPLISL